MYKRCSFLLGSFVKKELTLRELIPARASFGVRWINRDEPNADSIVQQLEFNELDREGLILMPEDRAVDIGRLKGFVLESFPSNSRLRNVILLENSRLTVNDFLAKMGIWITLLNQETTTSSIKWTLVWLRDIEPWRWKHSPSREPLGVFDLLEEIDLGETLREA